MIELISDEYEKRLNTLTDKADKAQILMNVLWYFDVDSINLIDKRTEDILGTYEIYKNAPYLIDNSVWFDAVKLLNKLQPRLF